MKINKKDFLNNIVGFEILKGNKYAVYYDPFKKNIKGGTAIKDTIRGRAAPYIMAFIGSIGARFLYDTYRLVENMINEKDKTKTNFKIFKDFIKEEYGTASNAFRRFIIDPIWQAAIGGFSYETIKDNLKDDKWISKNLNSLERFISGAKKPGRPVGLKNTTNSEAPLQLTDALSQPIIEELSAVEFPLVSNIPKLTLKKLTPKKLTAKKIELPTPETITLMNLTKMKEVAKNIGITLSVSGKNKNKAQLLEEILNYMNSNN